MKVKKETIIRTAVTFFAMVNSILVFCGKNILPWSENEVYQACSIVLDIVATVWAWWKNNSFSPNAIKADAYKAKLDGK
jgi:SPP1 family holin